MDESERLIENYRLTAENSRKNISDVKKAIRELRKTNLSYKDKLTIKAYKKAIAWNRGQVRECRQMIRNIKIASGKNYWTWIALSLITVVLAVTFPVTVWTFAPIWGMLLIGFVIIMIRTGR